MKILRPINHILSGIARDHTYSEAGFVPRTYPVSPPPLAGQSH